MTDGAANIDEAAIVDATNQCRANKANVIEGAQSVERLLEQIITRHFFLGGGDLSEEFRTLIVETETCTYAAKRRLVMLFVEKAELLKGAAKGDHDKLLADTMKYRNAFTHGGLSSDGTKVWLSYFEGGPKKIELTDAYFRTIEICLSRAYHETKRLFGL